MAGELVPLGEFDPNDPEYLAWQVARDAWRETLSGEIQADRAIDELGREIEDNTLASLDPQYAERVAREAEMKSMVHDLISSRSEELTGQYEERQRLHDVNDFLRYQQARIYAEQHGISIVEASLELFGVADDQLRGIYDILRNIADDLDDEDESDEQ